MTKTIARAAFVLLILFEIANYIRIFHFTLDFTWFGLTLTGIGVFAGLEITNQFFTKKIHVPLPSFIWPIAFISTGIDAFGDMAHWYSRWSWYDQVAHFTGGAVLTLVMLTVFTLVSHRHAWQHPTHLSYSYALGIATIFGVLYEIEEYLEDYFSFTNRLGDGRDTANDLLMNLLGGLTILVIIAGTRYVRKRTIR